MHHSTMEEYRDFLERAVANPSLLLDVLKAILANPAIVLEHLQLLSAAAAGILSVLTAIYLLKPSTGPVPAGKKLGILHSNLSDESAYDVDGLPDWKVKSLWVYPIKSCRGIEVAEATIIPTGFEHDRQFIFAEKRESGWTFITQRQYPLLATITPSIYLTAPSTGTLKTLIPSPSPRNPTFFTVPLSSSAPTATLNIWKESIPAHDLSLLIPQQLLTLQRYLGSKHPLGLFRAIPTSTRPVFRCAPRASDLGHQPAVTFSDAYPLHILNLHSTRDLAERISSSIPDFSAARFRANIIISGPRAFDEDDWRKLKIDEEVFHAACRTVRCKLPNVDQESGERHKKEPDETMRGYRDVDAGAPGKACMGLQLVPERERGRVEVGGLVEVLERGELVYINQ